METLNVSLDSWIIQDGNYPNFRVGEKKQFAIEFYPHSLKPTGCNQHSAINIRLNLYKICGQLVFRTEDVCVLDMGFLAYQETPPPRFAPEGSWVEGEIYLGIDPFAYFEHLKNIPGMPSLTYGFLVREILLETTPWLTTSDASGRTRMVRDEQNESFKEVEKTDAWHDDGGHASYVLTCASTDLK